MESKQMYVSDVNTVFGENEESLISHMDDIVMPALTSGYVYDSSEKTKYFFENVDVRLINDEYILSGILIKDTVVEVKSEYSKKEGLQKTDKKIKSAPYSLFMLYLCNHRMILVKNQDGSPDTRGFSAAFRNIIKKYIKYTNDQIREEAREKGEKPVYLPYVKVHVAGIKSAASVKEALKNVKKVTEMTFSFYPLNAEWDYGGVFGDIDEKIRKVVGSKKGKIILPSPGNIDGVAELIEKTEGMVRTTLKVKYNDDENGKKSSGTIKDKEISDVSNIDIEGDLEQAYEEVAKHKDSISAMNAKSENNIVEYKKYVETRKSRRE